MEIEFLNPYVKIWAFQWGELWGTMRDGQLILSASYSKITALAEGCGEKQQTCGFQIGTAGCPCNTGAYGPSFDGRNLIYIHSFSPGSDIISPICEPSQSLRNKWTHENFPMIQNFLMARKIQFLNLIFESSFLRFLSTFQTGISWNVSWTILDLNNQVKGKFPSKVL